MNILEDLKASMATQDVRYRIDELFRIESKIYGDAHDVMNENANQ